MKKYLVTIGIDVSKLKLDVCFVSDAVKTKHPHLIVNNDEKGIKSIINYLKKQSILATDALF